MQKNYNYILTNLRALEIKKKLIDKVMKDGDELTSIIFSPCIVLEEFEILINSRFVICIKHV